MKYQLQFLFALLKKLLVMLCLFTIIRVVFFLAYHPHFELGHTGAFLAVILGGLRFDLSALMILNVPVVFFALLPLRLRYRCWYRRLLAVLFIVFNALALLFNLLDLEYFSLWQRRMDFAALQEALRQADGSGIRYFVAHYGYLLAVFLAGFFVLVLASRRIRITPAKPVKGWRYYPLQSLLFVAALGLALLAIRGGMQYKPLDIINAGLYTPAKNTSLVTNNPFVLIKSMSDDALQPAGHTPNPGGQLAYVPLTHLSHPQGAFTRENVVVLVLESFSKEFIGALNPAYASHPAYRPCAPFLDSLVQHSLVCARAYANDVNSIRALPNILSGIPSWMPDDFTLSIYAQNEVQSIASLLKKKGYQSSFFHGGRNGTMNFDSYVQSVGFDSYYGMDEYDGREAYDGKWGIADDAFLEFFAARLNREQQPFVAGFFSLSTHDPYYVPEALRGLFPQGPLPIHRVARYTDYALREFFRQASAMPWYQNTLFVITADHAPRANEQYMPYYKSLTGRYAIPIIFFRPGNSLAGTVERSAQQTDILPTLLDLMQYNGRVYGFGQSLLDSSGACHAVNRISGHQYLVIGDTMAAVVEGHRVKELYNLRADSLQQHNLVNTGVAGNCEPAKIVDALVSGYQYSLIENKMTPEKYPDKH